MKSATDLALKAYETRPTRAEPLWELARHFRIKDMPHAALLFADRAMQIEYPKGDLLFVEDTVYRHGVRQEYAIAAYYDPVRRDQGREVCDGLALDRAIPEEVRNEARQNLFWYSQSLAELAPSFAPAKLQFAIPSGIDCGVWRAMNPSVCLWGGNIAINIRAVNYTIDEFGHYIMPEGDPAIRTRNFLGAVDPDDVSRVRHHQEVRADLPQPSYDQVLGLEDIRLFAVGGRLRASATVRQMNFEGWAEIITGTIRSGNSFEGGRVISEPGRHEKNWIPIANDLGQFVYKCDPTVIASPEGGRCLKHIPSLAADNFSGGSQAIPFHGGYLALIHEAIQSPRDGKRCYQHQFVWFDAELKLQKCSHRFYFEQNNQIEFAAGLCWHPDGERLILSYGIRDAEAWVATIVADEAFTLVNREEVVPHTPTPVPARREHNATAPVKAGADPLRYNQPLLSMAQVNEATQELVSRDLPQHPDVWKNWDTWLALKACESIEKDAPIMDAGGTRELAFLPGLRKLGYVRLTNMNMDEPHPETDSGIDWVCNDITGNYERASEYSFIACLSVIEHGVDWRKFLSEMARILRPGGQLCLSFDYWDAPIDTGDRMAFGAPVKIFQPGEVREMVDYADRIGLALAGDELDLRCRDRVVNWLELYYTFLCLLFRLG